MSPGRWFAVALIVLDLGAAAGYGYASDWRRLVYWVAAAVLTATVTF
jgi:hypothetical protein